VLIYGWNRLLERQRFGEAALQIDGAISGRVPGECRVTDSGRTAPTTSPAETDFQPAGMQPTSALGANHGDSGYILELRGIGVFSPLKQDSLQLAFWGKCVPCVV
jgi:hypothetical protein